jgi:penicillin amidase
MKSSLLKSASLVLLCLFLVASFTGIAGSASYDGKQVEIIRDDYGVPHIFAETYEDAFFGLGYATSEDRMFQMEYSRRIVQGRISEIIGESGLENDKLWRTIGWYRNAQEVAENMDLETRKLLEAYATGVNTYLEENRDNLLYLFDEYEINPNPWTVADSIACWYRLSLHFSNIDKNELSNLHHFEELIDQVGWEEAIQQIFQTPIVDESGAIVQQEDVNPELIAEIAQYVSLHGYDVTDMESYASEIPLITASHAWVVGGNRSTTGSAILHSDPQITIYAPSLWYEFHISCGDLDARGIGVAGAPGMLIGWNKNIAWGATAAGGDLNDFFKLNINPSNPNQYYYDGEIKDIEIIEEEIKVKNGRNVPITYRKTVWGPLVTFLLSNVVSGEEIAMKHVEVHNSSICSLQAMIKIMQANDWETFQKAIENYMSPAIHLIYGDKNGNIGYQLLAGLPLRSAEWPHFGRICQPGNSSQYDWQEVIPKKYIPHVFNPSSGVICTANNMAVGSWYPLPISFGTGDTIRSWRLQERLTMLPKFSQEDMLDIHRDTVNPAVREMVRLAKHIVYVQGQNLSEETTKALGILNSWNGEYNTNQPAYPLIENFNLMFRASVTPLVSTYGGGQAGLCYFAKTVKMHLDQDINYEPTTEEKEFIDFLLKDAWQKTVTKYGVDPSQWLRQYDKTILLEFEKNLENFESLDQNNNFRSPELDCKHTNTILSQHGNSYSQNVRFDDIDLSMSILPPGVSENPSNPFFNNQILLWSSGKLHQSPLTRETIEELATITVLIPEFPTWIIMPLFLIGSILVLIYRKYLGKMRTRNVELYNIKYALER